MIATDGDGTVIDDIGRRVAEAGSIERAAAIPGLFVAWCVNMGLLNEAVARDEARAVVRLKVREIGGAEFLVAACGGVLDGRVLSPAGMDFARRHYGAFEDFARAELPHPIEDRWECYDRVAPWLTARHLGGRGNAGRRGLRDLLGLSRAETRATQRAEQKRSWRPWKWRR